MSDCDKVMQLASKQAEQLCEKDAELLNLRESFAHAERTGREAREEITRLQSELRQAREERDEFKQMGQRFERESRSFFEQSCKNLERAEKAEAERDALAKFKVYVHKRLDEDDVPTHPNGPHSQKGCRIGDRLDILSGRAFGHMALVKERDRLTSSLRVAEEKLGRHEQCVRECIDALEKAGFDAHSLPELVYRVIEAKRVAEGQRERMRGLLKVGIVLMPSTRFGQDWIDRARAILKESLTPPAPPEPEGVERKPCLVNGCDKLVPHGYCWRHRNQQPGFADKVAAEMERLKAEPAQPVCRCEHLIGLHASRARQPGPCTVAGCSCEQFAERQPTQPATEPKCAHGLPTAAEPICYLCAVPADRFLPKGDPRDERIRELERLLRDVIAFHDDEHVLYETLENEIRRALRAGNTREGR